MNDLELLCKVSLFSSLAGEHKKKLAACSTVTVFAPQEVVSREGDVGNGLLVVKQGIIEVVYDFDGRHDVVGTLTGPEYGDDGGADFAGEIFLLEPQTWRATLQTVAKSQLLVVDREKLRAQVALDSGFGIAVATAVASALYRRLQPQASV